jgi:hypothetical protein
MITFGYCNRKFDRIKSRMNWLITKSTWIQTIQLATTQRLGKTYCDFCHRILSSILSLRNDLRFSKAFEWLLQETFLLAHLKQPQLEFPTR